MRPPGQPDRSDAPEPWLKRALPPVWSFLPASMPPMARRNYRHEVVTAALLPFMLTAVETGVITVLVRKAFAGVVADGTLNTAVAVLGAAKAFANIVSFLWVRVNHGRDKLVFIQGALWSMLALIAALSLIPRTPVGLALMVVGTALARMVWSGFITIRSTVWRANYGREIRARITGKTATVQVIMTSLLGAGMGLAMDLDERSYRVLLLAGCAVGAFGILSWRKIRVRRHGALLRNELADNGGVGPSANPIKSFRVLKEDRRFAEYMASMFVLGLGNLMVPPMLAIVTQERFGLSYLRAMLVTGTIAMALMPVAIPVWSRLLSRRHIVHFRAVHAWFFVVANGLFFLACWQAWEWLLYVAAAVQGLAFGGGALGWTLGHLDFAPPHRASQYMGVHVTLTGVRGLIGPFLGVTLYQWLEGVSAGSGAGVFAVSMVLSALGGLGFLTLALRMRAAGSPREEPVETTPPSRMG